MDSLTDFQKGAIRVIRAIVTVNNRFYLNALVSEDIFTPIVEAFVKNGKYEDTHTHTTHTIFFLFFCFFSHDIRKYNLLNSALLELFIFLGCVRPSISRLPFDSSPSAPHSCVVGSSPPPHSEALFGQARHSSGEDRVCQGNHRRLEVQV